VLEVGAGQGGCAAALHFVHQSRPAGKAVLAGDDELRRREPRRSLDAIRRECLVIRTVRPHKGVGSRLGPRVWHAGPVQVGLTLSANLAAP